MKKLLTGILVILSFAVAAHSQLDPDGIETRVIDSDGLREIVRATEVRAPLLINFWATWCGPCRAEFPELVKIDEEFRSKGLRFVIVSIDNATLADTLVSDFLKSYNARMPSYLLDSEDRRGINRAIRRINPRYTGGIPFTMLFNSAGKLVYQKSGVVSGRVLRRQINRLL